MSNLTSIEKIKLEKLFEMGGGYVLNFTNRTFQEFIMENCGINIFDARYDYGSGSKANRLRGFWIKESNQIVGNLLSGLLDYWRADKSINFQTVTQAEKYLLDECYQIITRLKFNSTVEKKEKKPLNQDAIERLKKDLTELTSMEPLKRGFAFEKFLNELFEIYNLNPRGSFRITGEQIDGSIQLGTDVYLVEAKWHNKQIDQSELLVFHGKVQGKSSWTRGLFVSYSGFTPDGLTAFSKGRSTNMVGMDCRDLFHILDGEMSLVDAINKKVRRAAETGEFYISVFDLSRGN
jgi:hypothetical protein